MVWRLARNCASSWNRAVPMSTCTTSRCGWKAMTRLWPYRWGERNIFTLPVEQGPLYEKAELTVNRKAGSVRWIPYVRSAAASDTIRRLGDLRLACEVHWAIDKDTLPFAMRTAMGALGGPCNFVSQKGTYSFSEPRRITAATISYNGKSAAVPFSGSSFTPPLREQDWSDDSVVELTFDNEQAAR